MGWRTGDGRFEYYVFLYIVGYTAINPNPNYSVYRSPTEELVSGSLAQKISPGQARSGVKASDTVAVAHIWSVQAYLLSRGRTAATPCPPETIFLDDRLKYMICSFQISPRKARFSCHMPEYPSRTPRGATESHGQLPPQRRGCDLRKY